MATDLLKPSFVDMSKLERELDSEATKYVPPKYREQVSAQTPLQIIANSIKRLTWDDAEILGAAIAAKLDENKNIAKAVQAAADELLKQV